MEFALNQDGKRVHALDADKSQDYFCPVCNGKVTPRQGEVNCWHYAHLTSCQDDWKYDMSEWHRKWQDQFPRGNREIVVECDGELHRADVMAYGYVLEFQHSPISCEEFNRRNEFYIKAGKKVIWVFDLIEEMNAPGSLVGHLNCGVMTNGERKMITEVNGSGDILKNVLRILFPTSKKTLFFSSKSLLRTSQKRKMSVT